MSVNTFPLLSTQEIIAALRDISISLTEEDMARPSAQRMMAVYEVILDQVMGMPRQACANIPLEDMEFLPYPDLHQDSASHATFLRELVRLMSVVGINDFSMRELRKPEAPGVRRILSAVINFIRFRENSMNDLDQQMRRSEELLEQRERMLHEHAQMKEKLEGLRVQREQERPETEERQRANAELQGELRVLLTEQGRLTLEMDELKERKGQLNEKIQSLKAEFKACQDENEGLRSRIVHSPEKIQQEIKETSGRLAETKSLISGSEQREREMRSRVNGLSQVEDTLEECSDLQGQMRNQEQKVQEALETIEWKRKKGRELEVRRQQVERQIRMSEEKMGRLHKGQETRMSQTRSRMNELNEKHEEVWQEREGIMKQIEENRRVVKEKSVEMEKETKETEAHLAMLRTDYHQLEAQIIRYQEEITAALNLGTPRS
ncbi:MAG: Nuf2 family-domain-containing protein [Piptocephalis tieghemiana]|nr:MAG: Nuf2 family-domain-containing protein [Piptocephalis tieghemiana]